MDTCGRSFLSDGYFTHKCLSPFFYKKPANGEEQEEEEEDVSKLSERMDNSFQVMFPEVV